MEQLVARWAHNPKVVGSSPAPATEAGSKESAFFMHFFQKQKPALVSQSRFHLLYRMYFLLFYTFAV